MALTLGNAITRPASFECTVKLSIQPAPADWLAFVSLIKGCSCPCAPKEIYKRDERREKLSGREASESTRLGGWDSVLSQGEWTLISITDWKRALLRLITNGMLLLPSNNHEKTLCDIMKISLQELVALTFAFDIHYWIGLAMLLAWHTHFLLSIYHGCVVTEKKKNLLDRGLLMVLSGLFFL